MPLVKKFKSENYNSVGNILHEASVDLLPRDLRDNEYARWMLGYDQLVRSRYETKNDNSGPFAFLGDFVASCLQQRIPFYFAALFHIGRVLSVASQGVENIQALSGEENWQITLANITATSRSRNNFVAADEQNHTELMLQKMCELGRINFQNDIRQAEKLWRLWLSEVAGLKSTLDNYEECWRNTVQYQNDRYGRSPAISGAASLCFAAWTVSAACSTKSVLIEEMTAAGVKLKVDTFKPVSPFLGGGQLIPIISAFLSSPADWGDLGHEISRLSRLLADWIVNEREQRERPEMDIALSILKAKYGDSNPFAEYVPCKRIATRELRALVKEHTLPNSRPSPWKSGWKNSLEGSLNFGSYSPLNPPRDLTGNRMEMIIRAADSTIKAHVDDSIKQAESWEQFLQSIFEAHCVEEFGEGAGGANKKRGNESEAAWSLAQFTEFISSVTSGLNKLGYTLSVPSPERLSVLLNKATRGESLYGDDAW